MIAPALYAQDIDLPIEALHLAAKFHHVAVPHDVAPVLDAGLAYH
jgi:hypothetical protein